MSHDRNAVVTHRPMTPTVPGSPQTKSLRLQKNVAIMAKATDERPRISTVRRQAATATDVTRRVRRQRRRNQNSCAHSKSSRRDTATATRMILKVFIWSYRLILACDSARPFQQWRDRSLIHIPRAGGRSMEAVGATCGLLFG